jgi:hypothetical protein
LQAAVQTAIKQAIRKERARVGGKAAADEPAEEVSAPHKYILIGLHTCGDLAHKVLFFSPKRVLDELVDHLPSSHWASSFFVFPLT